MRLVTEEELRRVVDESVALHAVERAFEALARNRVEQPPPMGFDFPDADGEVHVKGAALRGASVFAVKLASGFYRNPDRGLPVSSGLVLVCDQRTGAPLALFHDNAYLTEMRTAAAGALATRLLAPDPVANVAVLGTGAQARYQLHAISKVRKLTKVSAWSPSAERRARYCAEMTDALGVSFEAAESARDAVKDATLVITVTTAKKPLIGLSDVAPGSTVIAVGSDGPSKQELAVDLIAGADKLVVDRLSQCAALGELHHALEAGAMTEDDVYAELGDIVIGTLAGREGDELVVCDLTGVGAQDAAIAESTWRALGGSSIQDE